MRWGVLDLWLLGLGLGYPLFVDIYDSLLCATRLGCFTISIVFSGSTMVYKLISKYVKEAVAATFTFLAA